MSTLKRYSCFAWVLVLVFFCGKLFAQKTLIDVTADSTAILIGEQTVLHMSVTTDKGKDVLPLIPRDTLMQGVEVLNLSVPDTIFIDNNRIVIKQDILVTSFDSALYLLPPLKVIDGADTISSNQIALKVSTVPINMDKPEEFFDIKSVWKPPFVLADYYPLIYGILFALFLICVIGYVIQRLRNRKPLMPQRAQEPLLPPHEQAIKELDTLKQQKLWQQGRNKEYYTLLTDTLRKYIVRRFCINAQEMTSGEILDLICKTAEADSVYVNLKQILQLADFVKFAKLHPLPSENDLSLVNAYLFVNQTKEEELVSSENAPSVDEAEGSIVNNKEI
ncbi:MAG: hypothetical protein PHG27_02165 [Massilibacteroides sp.]|nr:hypothetical protein [Massilibacteroides sp.]MDD3061691.1 hypothetical protein [Massilibacteroides sp.]MDD4114391.1 hypothetical protein [Massilibacteroides sp.]MDD4660264.1 hypothetical protein [Massilibacteroides sp.]